MTHHSHDSLQSSSPRVMAPQEPSHGPLPAELPTPPAEWMPLDAIAEAWGMFGAHTRDAQGWLAASDAFAALAMESEAYQHTIALLARPHRSRGSRDAADAAISSLGDVLARWQLALLWLDHLRAHPMVPDEDEQDEARTRDLQARSRWHLLRVSRLQARLREEWMGLALWPVGAGQPECEEEEARS